MQCEPPFITSLTTSECIMCASSKYTSSDNNECRLSLGCPNYTTRTYIEQNQCKICDSNNYYVEKQKCIECPPDTISNVT